jgi:acyl carrier protein
MLLGELAGMLCEVTGADAAWVSGVTPDSRLDGDLWLDSVELAALGALLHRRYRIDLPAYLAGLDLDELIELRVKDLMALAGTGTA